MLPSAPLRSRFREGAACRSTEPRASASGRPTPDFSSPAGPSAWHFLYKWPRPRPGPHAAHSSARVSKRDRLRRTSQRLALPADGRDPVRDRMPLTEPRAEASGPPTPGFSSPVTSCKWPRPRPGPHAAHRTARVGKRTAYAGLLIARRSTSARHFLQMAATPSGTACRSQNRARKQADRLRRTSHRPQIDQRMALPTHGRDPRAGPHAAHRTARGSKRTTYPGVLIARRSIPSAWHFLYK
jgi:hypothetical protein